MDLDGKVAVVTGAGSGIGYSIAERLAAEGAAVCVNYLGYEDDAKALAQRLPKAIAFKADVSKAAEVQAMVDATVKALGTVDVLVNNAGLERSVPFLDIDEATWDLMLDVDLKGAFFCAQACGRVMRDSGHGGSIVNISSIHEDVPFPGFTPYCAAKGGLRMMMRNAAIELAPYNIRVNNVAPGAIATPINAETLNHPERVAMLKMIVPLMRMGKPEEVAEVALFLASDRSSYVTGSTYYVDGGMVRYSQPL
ncbi:MAG TPA: glucose 1-dehydrogenase [Candidatus Dormibacteraeota bacterium]|nr:glucose 1-dehydrogenase [Candidatus Dormibacteraeota bacterium]